MPARREWPPSPRASGKRESPRQCAVIPAPLAPRERGEGRGVRGPRTAPQPTSSMILPTCCEDSISACASAASASGNTRWITAFARPVS